MTAIRLPTGRAGQFAAIGFSLLVVATLWYGIADPLLSWYADRAEMLAQRTMLLRRMEDLAATLPMLKRRAAAAPADRVVPQDTLLQATSDATAGAELQQRVQDMAARAGVPLGSVETLAGRQDAGLRQIALRVSATATWKPLVQLLAAIERTDPSMSIDDLKLRSGINLARPEGLPISASFSVIAFRAGEGP